MSSQPERVEKTCLNCHAELIGRFCHRCGQENVVTKQNFWSLIQHFVYDLFHFDGKFFETLRHLLFSPGRVPKEFAAGRRASFLEPIRMYLFTSAIFFLVFFSIGTYGFTYKETPFTKKERTEKKKDVNELIALNPADTAFYFRKLALLNDSTREIWPSEFYAGMPFEINGKYYRRLSEYDSLQKKLPAGEKDNKAQRLFTRKLLSLYMTNDSKPNAILSAFANEFSHQFPYMLFISLPFFAGVLKLLYRKRKDLFYSDHAIFTIYHYIISFILLLVMLLLGKLNDWSGWSLFSMVTTALLIWWFIYLYLSMKRFYGQTTFKTILKFLILSLSASLMMLFLFIFFIVFTAYQL